MTFKSAIVCLLAIAAVAGCTRPLPKLAPALTSRDFILDATKSDEWKPTEVQVIEAKTALLDYLSSPHFRSPDPYSEKQRPGVRAGIDSYALQYLGKNYPGDQSGRGDKQILINAVCGGSGGYKDISKELVDVFDGGSCFFRAGYSIIQRKIMYFGVNGVA
jgi:hypothetical protein